MPETSDLDLLSKAAEVAGDIALGYFQSDPKIWDKSGGLGPVTEADLAVDAYLKEHLMASRPSYGWLSEETDDTEARLADECVFIVDPIDGTRSFIDQSRDWAVSIAIARRGDVIAGAVYLPARDVMYLAQKGSGARKNGQAIAASGTTSVKDATLLTAKPNLDARYWKSTTPPFNRSFRSSLAYRLCLAAEGRFDAMLTLRPTWEWDVAAGALIVSEAGGIATDGNGATAIFNNAHPQIAGMLAGGAIHPEIARELRGDIPSDNRFTQPG